MEFYQFATKLSLIKKINLYIKTESGNFLNYLIEGTFLFFLKNFPSFLGIVLRGLFYKILFKKSNFPFYIGKNVTIKFFSEISLGKNVFIDKNVYIHSGKPNGIKIGDGVRILESARLHIWNYQNIPNSGIIIGNHSSIGPFCFIHGHGGVKIGNYVMLAPYVIIDPGEHLHKRTDIPMLNQGGVFKGVVIEDDVWVGAGSIILGGVKIGKGSIIGAGSLVNKNIPSYVIAVGCPARVIKKRKKISKKRIKIKKKL